MIIPSVFKLVEKHADTARQWYWQAKQTPARVSKTLRFLALLLFGLGGLPPLIQAIGWFPKVLVNGWGMSGYLAIALGAACLAFDRYFGFSTAYARYTTTAMSIERALQEFRLDWYGLLAQYPGGDGASASAAPFVTRASAFLKTVLDLVDRETQDWVTEFRTNQVELEKLGQAQRETLRAGEVDVTVSGSVAPDEEVVVGIDSIDRMNRKGPGPALLGSVPPGSHRIEVRNLKTGQRGVSTAVVPPGGTVATEVSIPNA